MSGHPPRKGDDFTRRRREVNSDDDAGLGSFEGYISYATMASPLPASLAARPVVDECSLCRNERNRA